MKTETKAQHTPGAIKAAAIILDGKKLIQTSYGEKNAEGIADLIDRATAAPELLQACEEAYRFIKDTTEQYPDIEFPLTLHGSSDIGGRLRAAIAKATGGEE